MLGEILELNLTYLLFVQRELKHDFQVACVALNLEAEIANVLANLSVPQITKLATTNTLLLRFNWNDALILESLTNKLPAALTALAPAKPHAENAGCEPVAA